MEYGYLYCISNESMPEIFKIGIADQISELCNSFNNSDVWKPPTPYKIEFAKNVLYPIQKITLLYKLLSRYSTQINNSDYFKVSLEEVNTFFDLIDGDYWHKDIDEKEEGPILNEIKQGCRDISKCFVDKQHIRHVINVNNIWVGVYDALTNKINHDTNSYKSLSGFAENHYKVYKNGVYRSANGWSECECEIDGNWISTFNIPNLR